MAKIACILLSFGVSTLGLSMTSNCNGLLVTGADFAITYPSGVCVEKTTLTFLLSSTAEEDVGSGILECDADNGLSFKAYASSDCTGLALETVSESALNTACGLAALGGYGCLPQCHQTDCETMSTRVYAVSSCSEADISNKVFTSSYAWALDDCASNGDTSIAFSCSASGQQITGTMYSDAWCANVYVEATKGTSECDETGYEEYICNGAPTPMPTQPTTAVPTTTPTTVTETPTAAPTDPTAQPTTAAPTGVTTAPSGSPTGSPTIPTAMPTDAPTAVAATSACSFKQTFFCFVAVLSTIAFF